MRKRTKNVWLGMLVFAFGIAVTGCSTDPDPGPLTDPALNGRWVDDLGQYHREYVFNNGNWEYRSLANPGRMTGGVFTTNGDAMTLTRTWFSGAALVAWTLIITWDFSGYVTPTGRYSRADLRNIMMGAGTPAAEVDAFLADIFRTWEGTFSITGNTLDISFIGGTFTGPRRAI